MTFDPRVKRGSNDQDLIIRVDNQGSDLHLLVGVARFKLNPALARYLRQADRSEPGTSEPVAERPPIEPKRPWRATDRLGEDQIQELIDSFRAGATVRELVERYPLSRTAIKSLLRERGVRRRPTDTP